MLTPAAARTLADYKKWANQETFAIVMALPPEDIYKERVSCPTFSGGVADFPECIMPGSFMTLVDWLEDVARDPLGYKNPIFEVSSWEEDLLSPPEHPGSNDDFNSKKVEEVEADVKIAGVDVPKSLAERAGLL